MSFKFHRRGHQQRAERLEVRFSPTWTGDPVKSTVAVLGNSPPSSPAQSASPPDSKKQDPPGRVLPLPPLSPPPASSPLPVTPTTTPAAVPLPATSASVLVASPLAVPLTSSSSSSSVASLSAIQSSSTSTSIVQTTPVIVPAPSSKTPVFTTPTTFRNLPQSTFVPTTTLSVSASPTSSSSSSGMSTGAIVGIAAASIAGVAVVGVVGIWLLKRYFTSREEADGQPTFQRHSWMRNSVALPDDVPSPVARGPSVTPRPPTMIERKQTHNFSNISHGGYPQGQGGYNQGHGGYPQDNNMGIAYTGYQDSPYGAPPMPSYNQDYNAGPSPHTAQPVFSPIGSPAPSSQGVPTSFDETMPPMQHASFDGAAGAPVYFSRHDSSTSQAQHLVSAKALPEMPNPYEENAGANGYATLSRSSLTPYQAQQYAAISRQLQDPGLESVVEVSPFDDPAAAPTSAPASAADAQYADLTPPSRPPPRVDSTPPMLPPMRTLSPVGPMGGPQPSIAQIADAFPATPTSPMHPAFPAAVANPRSPRSSIPSAPRSSIPAFPAPTATPRSPSFKHTPPLSPAPGAQGQIVAVPDAAMHVGRETPVQFGFNEPVAAAEAGADTDTGVGAQATAVPNTKRMSVASRKSVAHSGRPETMYEEDDAYGGI